MATSSEAEAFARDQRRLIDAGQAAFAAWLAEHADAPASEVVATMLDIVGQFASAVAEHAVAWYALLRERAEVRDGAAGGIFGRKGAADFAPEPFDAFDARGVARDTQWALKQDDQAGALSRVADQHIAQAGKDTIALNAERDPADPRWARMPVGVTCAWCLMLASRGSAYASRRTAGYAADGQKYHANDDCTPVPVWDVRDLPYDADALYQVYADARAKAGGDPNAIAAQIRRDHWDTVTDGVPPDDPPDEFYLRRNLHPDYWDRRQAATRIDFKGEQLKPIEILSVERLARHGVTMEWTRNDQSTSTGDFTWAQEQANVELKSLLPSTPADTKRIRRPVLGSAKRAWKQHRVVKDEFIVDISPRTLDPFVRQELAALVGTQVDGVRIRRLWILTDSGIDEIT